MIEILNLTKRYKTGDLIQVALNNVSVSFDNYGFVGILGPSGSGKTTLLNMISGLEKYDSGEIKIDGVSTSKYTDSDFDYYRNQRIGFIFQNYNLIPHQTVYKNIELAIDVCGSKDKENKIHDVLKLVGLENQSHKKPAQLSGGQQQRVAIARALVNNPSIILADEPTGSLDSVSSVEILDILKKISKEKLVIMVSHNETLLNKYADRTLVIDNGNIISDTKPCLTNKESKEVVKKGKTSFPILTSFRLSFNNLLTKKARTLLIAFAHSIGIIAIALVLAFFNGTNEYLNEIQRNTMSEYPLTLQSETYNLIGPILNATFGTEKDYVNGSVEEKQVLTRMFTTQNKNDLHSFIDYLDNNYDVSNIGLSSVEFDYSVSPLIYTKDVNDEYVELNPHSILNKLYSEETMKLISSFSNLINLNAFKEVHRNELINNTEVIAGRYPEKYNEVAIVLSEKTKISDLLTYSLGLRSYSDISKAINNPSIKSRSLIFNYDELMACDLRLIHPDELYKYDENLGYYTDISNNLEEFEKVFNDSEKLEIVGVLYAPETLSSFTGIVYLDSLSDYIQNRANESLIVKDQLENEDINIFTGKTFEEEKDNGGSSSLKDNLIKLNYQDIKEPTFLTFYFNDYSAKDNFEKIIEEYNENVDFDKMINYSDYSESLIEYIKDIMEQFTTILIIFIIISFFVSFVMISIVTMISVIERKKEIAILRAIGVSKRGVLSVFSAETFIIGLLSGLIGIVISYLLVSIINSGIYNMLGIGGFKAILDMKVVLVLILGSIIVSLIAGFIPSLKAVKKDPALSLRSE